MERSSPAPLPDPAGVPRSWDRRYGHWARRSVRHQAAARPAPRGRDSDGGIAEAALLAVRVAVLSGIAGLGSALLCNLGLAAGLVGLALATALCWWWMAEAMAFISRR